MWCRERLPICLPSELTYIKRASMFLCQRREVRRDAERTEKLEKAPHKTLTICTYLTPETRPTNRNIQACYREEQVTY